MKKMTVIARFLRLSPLLCVLLALAGCATPGPMRGYYLLPGQHEKITQFDPADALAAEQSQKSYLAAFDKPLALAYDSFTDHFFIRVYPGNFFLVVDRPAQRIKRSFTLHNIELPSGGGDIAIRSRDQHLFLSHPTRPELIEVTLYGYYVRTIPLNGATGGDAPLAVAYDQAKDRLLTLSPKTPDRVAIRSLDGKLESTVVLDEPGDGRVLAYDSVKREILVPLPAQKQAIGIFSMDGKLLRTHPLPAGTTAVLLDAGPHSFLRLF